MFCVYSYHETLQPTILLLPPQYNHTMMKSILILLSLQAYCCLAFSTQSPFSAVVSTTNINRRSQKSSNIILSSNTNNDDGPLGFLQGIFSSSSAVAVAPEPQIPDFVVDSDYTIAGVSF